MVNLVLHVGDKPVCFRGILFKKEKKVIDALTLVIQQRETVISL
jgi:hypothetical protein